jgi:redox-sensitive bicupin YhaK (pirin superfamily)
LTPNYGGLSGDKYDRTQQWALIVGDVEDASTAAPVKLHQDINMFAAELKADGVAVPFELKAGRIGYLLCMEGAATVAGAHGEETLQRHEAAHLAGPNQLTVKGDAHMLLIEMTGAGNF